MTTILRVGASARKNRSITRDLTDRFIRQWLTAQPGTAIIDRDVGVNPPPMITEDWIAAAFSKEEQRTADQKALLALSDAMIEELDHADLIVIGAPMYNYGMPAALKAWVDQVVRIDKTFTFDLARGDRPLAPIMSGKTLVLLTSWGEFGFGPGEINDGANHFIPHVKTVSKYFGVDHFHHVGVEYQEFGDERFMASKKAAEESVCGLVSMLTKSGACQAA